MSQANLDYYHSYFPKLNITVGTNTYYISCEDYIEPE